MKNAMRRLKNESGQTATEYMLIIAVVVLGAVAGASVLLPRFKEAMVTLSDKIKSTMETSTNTSTGTMDTNVSAGQAN